MKGKCRLMHISIYRDLNVRFHEICLNFTARSDNSDCRRKGMPYFVVQLYSMQERRDTIKCILQTVLSSCYYSNDPQEQNKKILSVIRKDIGMTLWFDTKLQWPPIQWRIQLFSEPATAAPS